MGQSPHDLELIMSVYMASKPWNKDPDVIPLEWKKPNDALADRPCCFAYINGDELVRGIDSPIEKRPAWKEICRMLNYV